MEKEGIRKRVRLRPWGTNLQHRIAAINSGKKQRVKHGRRRGRKEGIGARGKKQESLVSLAFTCLIRNLPLFNIEEGNKRNKVGGEN